MAGLINFSLIHRREFSCYFVEVQLLSYWEVIKLLPIYLPSRQYSVNSQCCLRI